MAKTITHTTAITWAITLILNGTTIASADDTYQIPKKPDLGTKTESPLPPLGNVSGIGKATAGIPAIRLEKTVRDARTKQQDVLRGKRKPTVLDKLGRSVVLVVTPTKLGTATLIGRDGTFITSWHIVEPNAQVGLIFMPNNSDRRPTEADAIAATVTRHNPTNDLALVQLSKLPKGLKPIKLSSKLVYNEGTLLKILGHPYGEIWSLTDGTLTKAASLVEWKSPGGKQHQAQVVHFQSQSATGNAGGPVLDNNDRLIAIDVLRTDDNKLLNLGVSISEVRKLLQSPILPSAPVKPATLKGCDPKRLSTNRTKDNHGTVHILDLNCNGKADAMMLVPDNTKTGNHLANDANENGTTDSVYFDFNRDGQFDEVRFDTDEDGKADLVGNDLDSELIPARTRVLEK